MKTFRYIFGVLILTLSISGSAFAQSQGTTLTILNLDDGAFPTLTLRLSVVDSTGRPLTGLNASAIELLEDGSPAEIVSVRDVTDTEQGIATVLVIDVSDSMAGAPLAAAKESAEAFVDSLGPNDQVAVLAFGSTVREVQPFTSDKASARAAIDELELSGATALYDAAHQGVLTAARSTLARRVVILLGDGAEFGGASLSDPDDALKAAQDNSITIHTIALGFGADAAYFQQLSGLTGGVAFNAPTPDELDAQWLEISGLLRQQVEVVVNSKVPGDGQSHTLVVRVKTGNEQAEATGTFRSKGVAPVVSLSELDSPLTEAVTLTASVTAQGEVASVVFKLDGKTLTQDTESPFTAEIDPAGLSSGSHTLVVEATDESGTTGSTELAFEVAAVPPTISLSLSEGQKVDAPTTITPEIESQSETNQVVAAVDGQTIETLTSAPFRFTIDPARLSEGTHTLTVTVTDANGESAAAEVGFTVVKSAAVGNIGLLAAIIGGAVVIVLVVAVAAVLIMRRRPAAVTPTTATRLEVATGPDKDKVFSITEEKKVIGRLSTAAIVLNDPSGALHLSREHARIWKDGTAVYLEDNGSRYGTFVNGARVTGTATLTGDAIVKVGEVELVFHGPAPAAGDLRATRFEAGALPTMIYSETEPEKKSAAENLDQTQLAEADEDEQRRTRLKDEPASDPPINPRLSTMPMEELAPTQTAEAAQSDLAAIEKTQLMADEADSAPDPLRKTQSMRADPPIDPLARTVERPPADDAEDLRRTRLKKEDGDSSQDDEDENRKTRLKKG